MIGCIPGIKHYTKGKRKKKCSISGWFEPLYQKEEDCGFTRVTGIPLKTKISHVCPPDLAGRARLPSHIPCSDSGCGALWVYILCFFQIAGLPPSHARPWLIVFHLHQIRTTTIVVLFTCSTELLPPHIFGPTALRTPLCLQDHSELPIQRLLYIVESNFHTAQFGTPHLGVIVIVNQTTLVAD